MSAHLLDTHRIVKRLQQAGFTDSQAETVTDVMRETREFDLSNLATKADVILLKKDIIEFKTDLVKWSICIAVVHGGLVVTLVKLLPSFGH